MTKVLPEEGQRGVIPNSTNTFGIVSLVMGNLYIPALILFSLIDPFLKELHLMIYIICEILSFLLVHMPILGALIGLFGIILCKWRRRELFSSLAGAVLNAVLYIIFLVYLSPFYHLRNR